MASNSAKAARCSRVRLGKRHGVLSFALHERCNWTDEHEAPHAMERRPLLHTIPGATLLKAPDINIRACEHNGNSIHDHAERKWARDDLG